MDSPRCPACGEVIPFRDPKFCCFCGTKLEEVKYEHPETYINKPDTPKS